MISSASIRRESHLTDYGNLNRPCLTNATDTNGPDLPTDNSLSSADSAERRPLSSILLDTFPSGPAPP